VVSIAGERVVAVEPRGARRADADLGNAAVIPGLVNAHTHLDLSGLRGRCPPTPDFTGWLRQVIAHRHATTPGQVEADVRAGLAEALRYGTTLLGDISAGGTSWDALAEAPLRAVVFYEMLGLSRERARQSWRGMLAWLNSRRTASACRPGLSPHAPYSTRFQLFFIAGAHGVPAATHLAETAAELELLRDRSGPFVPFLHELGAWSPEGLVRGPEHALQLLGGRVPVLIVHGSHLHPDTPIPAQGTLVYCPRTHAAFGHTPHPFRDFLARGVRVALGTDSLASNPDLDVLAEARFLHARYPDVPGAVLLHLATLAGAEALGWQDEAGSLTPGKSADLAVVPLPEEEASDPHRLLLGSSAAVRGVLFRGAWVVPPLRTGEP
jgi:cytosine/adenosine deaminase-related metal-dependent hydrolase